MNKLQNFQKSNLYKISLTDVKNTKQNKILVLDFDLTITDIYTEGKINLDLFYWYEKDNFDILVKTLQKFKSLDWKIYIVSRGIFLDIQEYLNKLKIYKIFDGVFGANDIFHLSHGTSKWSEYKTQFINMIVEKNKTHKHNIYFIDDTEENIYFAKSNGFVNSFILPYIGISSITLTSMLEKILIDTKDI